MTAQKAPRRRPLKSAAPPPPDAVAEPGSGLERILARAREPKLRPEAAAMWRYAAERQAVLMRRRAGESPPWTLDPIIAGHKFTCLYRADDRISQRLLRDVVYDGKRRRLEDVVFRTLLFKVFNREATWDALEDALGEQPSLENYDFRRYARVLDGLRAKGEPVYGSAYLMVVPPRLGESTNQRNHLRLVELLADRAEDLAGYETLEGVYENLRKCDSVGNFLAYQWALDLNYGPHFKHDERFVVAGPGAVRGLRRVVADPGDYRPPDLVRWLADHSEREIGRTGIGWQPMRVGAVDRPLQPVDLEHLLCEFDKYARVAYPEAESLGQVKIKFKYDAATARPLEALRYPDKWSALAAVAALSAGKGTP